MADETERRDWAALINSVRTPLGFFTLFALIVEAILTGTAVVTDKMPMWAPLALLAALFVSVTLIVLLRPTALYHPKDWPVARRPMTVNLLFPGNILDVDLDIENCRIEIRDKLGQKKDKQEGSPPNLKFGHGGWSLQITDDIEPADSVRLELVESNGQRWRVKPFSPYETSVQVAKLA